MGRHILIIDDHKDICEVIAAALTTANFRVSYATDRDGAYNALKNSADAIVLDYVMPGEFCRSLLQDLKANRPKTRIVLMSVDPSARMVAEEFDLPFMLKPFNLSELTILLKGLCDEEGDRSLG